MPYNQGITEKVTSNFFKRQTLNEIPNPWGIVNFSNNILKTQARINERENELDSTYETFINLKDKSFNNSIDW